MLHFQGRDAELADLVGSPLKLGTKPQETPVGRLKIHIDNGKGIGVCAIRGEIRNLHSRAPGSVASSAKQEWPAVSAL